MIEIGNVPSSWVPIGAVSNGIVADPEVLSASELWTLVTSATDEDALTIDSISRHG